MGGCMYPLKTQKPKTPDLTVSTISKNYVLDFTPQLLLV